MMHLILGGAGSGKSTLLTQYIRQDVETGTRAFLIIPEQQANLSERTMLPALPPHAGLTFTIAGFSRLAGQVAATFGGAAVTPLARGLCSLLMWQNLRELNGILEEYHSSTPRSDANLTRLLIETIEELRADAVTPDMLERAANKLPAEAALRPKLRDLALIYATYDNSLAEAFEDSEKDALALLAHTLEEHDYFHGSHVYIDSFTSFTAEEYAVLREILRQAADVTVTLCENSTGAHNPAFDSVRDTSRRLCELCAREHIEVETVTLGENRRTARPELIALEKELWDFSLTADQCTLPPEEARDAVTLLRCTNIYAEAEAVAYHVLDLVHHGTAYGDIAVMIRDGENYRGVLDAAFERHHIPFYFSEKTSLAEKPLSRLILSALRAVAHGFPAQEILTLLKTGLCPVSWHDLDLFEEYVSTWKITGAGFAEPLWTRNPDGYADTLTPRGKEILDAANRVRETVMTPLLRLHTAVSGGGKLPALACAVYDFLNDLSLSDRLARLAEQELSEGYLKEAGETVRIFDTVLQTLTQISARLPDLVLGAEEFAAALGLVFAQTEIASVPSLHDSVTVGSAATMRVENVKVAFVLGLNEGEFPQTTTSTGLLSDAEKQKLPSLGVPLGSRDEMQASDELLYLYRAMTKPSEHLFASTVLSTVAGDAKAPSVAYNRLLFLFPYLNDRTVDFDLSDLPAAPDARPDTVPKTADLSPNDARRIFGDTLWLSQSRIQSFVLCPYSFYCNYLLSLRERREARLDYSDSGNFLHYFLEHFLRDCLDGEGDFHLPAPEAIEPMARRIVSGYLAAHLAPGTADPHTLHLFRRLYALTLVLLRDILDELSHSRFRPHDFELKIGGKSADAPAPYEIPLSDGRRILLGGTVDRVDWFRRGDELYLRVVDYKSGSREFSLDDVRRGLNLQLLIYLFTLCKPEKIHPAGAVYIATKAEKGAPAANRTGLILNDPDVLSAMNDALDPTYLAGVKQDKKTQEFVGTALTGAEDFQSLEADIRDTLTGIGEAMLRGHAARTPSEDACRFCPLRASCPDAHHA